MISIEKTNTHRTIELEKGIKSALNQAAATAREKLVIIHIELENALIRRDVLKQAITRLQVSKAQIRTELY